MGGGTSSGGGSTSGAVDYPEYMKESHGVALEAIWSIVLSETETPSPYAGWSSADPSAIFGIPQYSWEPPASLLAKLKSGFPTNFDILTRFQAWLAALVAADGTYIATATAAHSAALASRLTNEVLPRYRMGMLDIGAACSSAFTIGQTVMENENTRLAAKFDAELRQQQYQMDKDIAFKGAIQEMEWGRLLVTLATEITRIYLAAKYEIDSTTVEMAAKDRKWDAEMFEFYNHTLAAISGAAVAKGNETRSSAIGGVLSGAAAGALVGSTIPGVGTAVGAAAGAGLGLLSSFF